jgi:1,3-beta-glucan synthase
VSIQRAIQKILIAVFLSREFKHDETNRAWWSGKWYGRGLGNSAMSQPAREFIVKIVEMSLWSSDLDGARSHSVRRQVAFNYAL